MIETIHNLNYLDTTYMCPKCYSLFIWKNVKMRRKMKDNAFAVFSDEIGECPNCNNSLVLSMSDDRVYNLHSDNEEISKKKILTKGESKQMSKSNRYYPLNEDTYIDLVCLDDQEIKDVFNWLKSKGNDSKEIIASALISLASLTLLTDDERNTISDVLDKLGARAEKEISEYKKSREQNNE